TEQTGQPQGEIVSATTLTSVESRELLSNVCASGRSGRQRAKANIESTSHFLFVRPTALAKSRRSVATRRSSGCQPEVFRLAAISSPVPTTSMSALVKSRQVQCNRHVRFTSKSGHSLALQSRHE